jgi:hypothetical protein
MPGDRRGGVARHHLEAGRQFGDLVAVAHPHVEQPVALVVDAVLNVAQQRGMSARADLGVAEFALGGISTLPPSCAAMVCMP